MSRSWTCSACGAHISTETNELFNTLVDLHLSHCTGKSNDDEVISLG